LMFVFLYKSDIMSMFKLLHCLVAPLFNGTHV
jgi:hypothetical protein